MRPYAPAGDSLLSHPITGIAVGCCARAATGHAATPPPTRVMKSRRLIGRSQAPQETQHCIGSNEYFDRGLTGVKTIAAVHSQCRCWVISLHYRTATLLSASPQLAESIRAAKRFRVVPIADSCGAANWLLSR